MCSPLSPGWDSLGRPCGMARPRDAKGPLKFAPNLPRAALEQHVQEAGTNSQAPPSQGPYSQGPKGLPLKVGLRCPLLPRVRRIDCRWRHRCSSCISASEGKWEPRYSVEALERRKEDRKER